MVKSCPGGHRVTDKTSQPEIVHLAAGQAFFPCRTGVGSMSTSVHFKRPICHHCIGAAQNAISGSKPIRYPVAANRPESHAENDTTINSLRITQLRYKVYTLYRSWVIRFLQSSRENGHQWTHLLSIALLSGQCMKRHSLSTYRHVAGSAVLMFRLCAAQGTNAIR